MNFRAKAALIHRQLRPFEERVECQVIQQRAFERLLEHHKGGDFGGVFNFT